MRANGQWTRDALDEAKAEREAAFERILRCLSAWDEKGVMAALGGLGALRPKVDAAQEELQERSRACRAAGDRAGAAAAAAEMREWEEFSSQILRDVQETADGLEEASRRAKAGQPESVVRLGGRMVRVRMVGADAVRPAGGGREKKKGVWARLFGGGRGASMGGDGTGRQAGEEKRFTLPGGAEMEMVWCPPGEFVMGSPEGEEGRWPSETQHRVTLTQGFWMAKYPVTQAQWKSVMGNNPAHVQGDDLPVESVSWEDCVGFCGKAGHGLRLPTEAEWEYACRAGRTGAFAGTGRLEEMGWYGENSGGMTHSVGKKQPNAWGLYDMHGNVEEWCADCAYWMDDYPSGAATDPSGPASGLSRMLRGGSWCAIPDHCRSAARTSSSPDIRFVSVGFRPCCSAGEA